VQQSVGKPHQGRRSVSPVNTALLRKKDKQQAKSRDEKTASIRSYPKRLSPTILSDEFYENLEGIKTAIVVSAVVAATFYSSSTCSRPSNSSSSSRRRRRRRFSSCFLAM